MSTPVTNRPASAKTLVFLFNLINDRSGIEAFVKALPTEWAGLFKRVLAGFAALTAEGMEPDALNAWFAYEEWPALEQSDASRFIDGLKRLPYKNTVAKPGTVGLATEPGVYKVGDTIFKVKSNRSGTNLYAHRLVVDGKPNEAYFDVHFEYAGSLVKNRITSDTKLTWEEAKEFGALYGTCVLCGRLLTNELSIALGIGPVCGNRQFGGEFIFQIATAKLGLGERLTAREQKALEDGNAS